MLDNNDNNASESSYHPAATLTDNCILTSLRVQDTTCGPLQNEQVKCNCRVTMDNNKQTTLFLMEVSG